jgi:hypothetical protein
VTDVTRTQLGNLLLLLLDFVQLFNGLFDIVQLGNSLLDSVQLGNSSQLRITIRHVNRQVGLVELASC